MLFAADTPLLEPALIDQLAADLRQAQATRTPIAPIRERLAPGGVAAAYAVQEAVTRHGLAQGRRLSGRKIGLTSTAVQQQLGVDQPDYGMLFTDMALCDDETVPMDRVLQAKVEAEVAFVLARDLTDPLPGPAEVIAATAFVLPAIEIVGSRIANWAIGLLDTIADNASSGLYVVGATPRRLDQIDLRAARMSMWRGEQQVSSGSGAACLGLR